MAASECGTSLHALFPLLCTMHTCLSPDICLTALHQAYIHGCGDQGEGGADGSSSPGGAFMQQQLTTAAPQDVYYSSRSEALHNVEATIVELGGIFQQLAHMVRPSADVPGPAQPWLLCS